LTPWTLQILVVYLREAGVIGPDQPATRDEVDQVIDAYCRFLRVERRLAPLTVTNAQQVLGRFLHWRIAQGPLALDQLDPAAIHRFVMTEAARLSPFCHWCSASVPSLPVLERHH
jgi:hypothetical protein